ncbi:hypothetical protein VTN02DRAFT_3309 [Thermoascus thermophilus]
MPITFFHHADQQQEKESSRSPNTKSRKRGRSNLSSHAEERKSSTSAPPRKKGRPKRTEALQTSESADKAHQGTDSDPPEGGANDTAKKSRPRKPSTGNEASQKRKPKSKSKLITEGRTARKEARSLKNENKQLEERIQELQKESLENARANTKSVLDDEITGKGQSYHFLLPRRTAPKQILRKLSS